MKDNLNQLKALTIASLKMYYRNKTAIFFSLFIPLFIIIIFGSLFHNGKINKYSLVLVDNSHTQISRSINSFLKKTNAFDIKEEDYNTGLKDLKEGNKDIVLEMPSDLSISPNSTSKINLYYDQSRSQNTQTAILVINNVLAQYNQGLFTQLNGKNVPDYINLSTKGIQTNNLTEIDFIIPGIIAFSIMQMGIFSVSFAFASMKKTGALKRLKATPAKPSNFILSQSISRLILSVAQVLILLGVGIYGFNLHMYGNIFSFLSFIILGSIVFLAIGFAVAGYAKDENQVAPIANVISLPMTFLSGVFFPRSLMPDFLKNITSILPLTYLSDAIREIANNGTSIAHLGGDLLGLIIWAVVCMIIAIKVFKWE